jgi:pimeloyl-ACP methyl ester carboxylesterase
MSIKLPTPIPSSGYLAIDSIGRLHFRTFGRGSRLMICFHGYGLDAGSFEVLHHWDNHSYTLLCFDHAFHGQSEMYTNEVEVPVNVLCDPIVQFAKELGYTSCSIMAFSLGGKLALCLTERYPDFVEKLVLIAPDGIKTSFWYSLATYPLFFRAALRRIVLRPWFFNRLVQTMRVLKLVDKGILRFASSQMNTVKKRYRLYNTWVAYKQFNPNLRTLAVLLNNRQIPVLLYLGKYDKIITQSNLYFFIKQLAVIQVVTLPVGHNHLIDYLAKEEA